MLQRRCTASAGLIHICTEYNGSSSFPGPRGSRLAVPTRLGTPNPYTQWPMGRNASVAERGTADPKYLDGIADSYWSQRLRLVGG